VNYFTYDHIRTGIKTEHGIADLVQNALMYSMDVPTSMEQIIEAGEDGLFRLNKLVGNDLEVFPEDDVTFMPCVRQPEKILCVGLNYRTHADETNTEYPEQPVIFGKYDNALAAHRQEITLSKRAEQYDYEAELVIVIGKEVHDIKKKEARDAIFGYTCGNDLSARDAQFVSGQWLIGKNMDGFAPIGPYLVTADEFDPASAEIRCEVNGQVMQRANTSDMIFSCEKIVSYVSRYMTLKPGDLIFTGTPGGVMLGKPEAEQKWLVPGDTVAVEIEGIGRLENTLI
jgi:2-keto-4-pentenoate hydratase/2-oxohepta-3-ene-1,7-dioic acid hydratase in catechol pathway